MWPSPTRWSNTSDLIPKFLLPVIRAQLGAGRSVTRSVAVIACWARYAEGVDENGESYPINDVLESRLRAAAERQRQQPSAFLEDNVATFGELVDDSRFGELFVGILQSLHEHGVRHTLARLPSGDPARLIDHRAPNGKTFT